MSYSRVLVALALVGVALAGMIACSKTTESTTVNQTIHVRLDGECQFFLIDNGGNRVNVRGSSGATVNVGGAVVSFDRSCQTATITGQTENIELAAFQRNAEVRLIRRAF